MKQAVRTCVGLALLLIGSYLLNERIFPYFDAVAPEARDISTYCGVIFFGILAVVAYRKPSVFHEKIWTATSLGLIVIGSVLLYLGVTQSSSLLLIAGSPFGGIGAVWFSVLVCISLTQLDRKLCAISILVAFMLKYCAMVGLAFIDIPLMGALILSFLCTVATYFLVLPYAREPIKTIQRVESAAELDVTNPSSFLPVSSPLFITIILFNAAEGFALTFQRMNSTLPYLLLIFIPVVVIALVVGFGKKRLNSDILFQVAALLVFAGFLISPLTLMMPGGFSEVPLSSIFLRSGTDCFGLLMYFLIARVGARNALSTISMVALTIGSSWLGIAIGAFLGQITHGLSATDPFPAIWISTILTFGFVIYNFIILKRFSFEETIRGIRPVPVAVAAPESETTEPESPSFEESCEAIITEYGLTNREGDVLRLLARGRTSSVIQEKLVLSHNTIKTHVRHIYTKMDIHSQQDLIDMVEAGSTTSPPHSPDVPG